MRFVIGHFLFQVELLLRWLGRVVEVMEISGSLHGCRQLSQALESFLMIRRLHGYQKSSQLSEDFSNHDDASLNGRLHP